MQRSEHHNPRHLEPAFYQPYKRRHSSPCARLTGTPLTGPAAKEPVTPTATAVPVAAASAGAAGAAATIMKPQGVLSPDDGSLGHMAQVSRLHVLSEVECVDDVDTQCVVKVKVRSW